MAKINIVIGDIDVAYVNSVEKYMNDNQGDNFYVASFTDKEKLISYIDNPIKKIDVLLIGPEIYEDKLMEHKIPLIAILSSGRLPREYKSCEIVSKYQLGDALAENIMHLFSDKNEDIIMSRGQKNTRIIGVYSPIGGCGKSSICYGLSLLSAQNEFRTFYLNLENAPSTNLFFECNGEYSISHMFYYLKAKNKNLHLKIQGIRQVDMFSNIHYFNPPESVIEIYDNTPEEYALLIDGMRNINDYDVIFVDLSSDIERCNIKVLDCCDEILLVTNPDSFSSSKITSYIKELELLYKREKIDIIGKIKLVENKVTENDFSSEVSFEGIKQVALKIPMVSPLYSIQNKRVYMNINSSFGEVLKNYVDTLKQFI